MFCLLAIKFWRYGTFKIQKYCWYDGVFRLTRPPPAPLRSEHNPLARELPLKSSIWISEIHWLVLPLALHFVSAHWQAAPESARAMGNKERTAWAPPSFCRSLFLPTPIHFLLMPQGKMVLWAGNVTGLCGLLLVSCLLELKRFYLLTHLSADTY